MKNEAFLKHVRQDKHMSYRSISNKKMHITIFPNKKSICTKIFLIKKFHLNFLIAESPDWQDSYTTYPKISAN